MLRLTQHLLGACVLDQVPVFHDSNIVRQVLDHAKIVRDKQVGHAQFLLQIIE